MNIVVTVKQVLDPNLPPSYISLDESGKKIVAPSGIAPVMNGYDANALEAALKRGERIEIRGFGSFQVKVREAREGRNPKTGEPVHISAKRTPFFKVGKELKEMVDGMPAGTFSDGDNGEDDD